MFGLTRARIPSPPSSITAEVGPSWATVPLTWAIIRLSWNGPVRTDGPVGPALTAWLRTAGLRTAESGPGREPPSAAAPRGRRAVAARCRRRSAGPSRSGRWCRPARRGRWPGPGRRPRPPVSAERRARRMRVTIAVTCALSARPEPVIAALTSLGVCRATGIPRRAATSIATPAAWAVPITVCTLCWANTRSTATISGRCSASQLSSSSSSRRNRMGVSRSDGVRTTSTPISWGGRPGRPSTTPRPHRVRPGSTPSTRTPSPPTVLPLQGPTEQMFVTLEPAADTPRLRHAASGIGGRPARRPGSAARPSGGAQRRGPAAGFSGRRTRARPRWRRSWRTRSGRRRSPRARR